MPIKKGTFIAALLTIPLMGLPLLAGNGFYSGFWWQLTTVIFAGAVADIIYTLSVRKLITPTDHPHRARLRWLIFGPLFALLLLWLIHIPLVIGAAIALLLGLLASFLLSKHLIWESLASAIGFGTLYTILYIFLHIPITGPIETIPSFSGTLILSRPTEEVLLVFLFGSLWGPLLSAFRQQANQDPSQSFHPKNQLAKQGAISLFIILMMYGTYWTFDQFIRVPSVYATTPAHNTYIDDLTFPITVNFDRPIDRKQIMFSISPLIGGDISFADPYIQPTFVRQLTFTPNHHLEPDTEYVVNISEMTNVFGRQKQKYTFKFKTASLPTVASVTVKDDQKDVNICEPIIIDLTQKAGRLAEFSFELDPPTPTTIKLSENQKEYTITPDACLNQNTQYKLDIKRLLTVYDSNNNLTNSTDLPTIIRSVNFTSKSAPGINSFSPQGTSILADTKTFSIEFTEEMQNVDPNDYVTIQPTLSGSWQWQDNHTLTFTSTNNLQLNTKYSISIRKGLKDTRSGFISEDLSYNFTTIGHVKISSLTPRLGSAEIKINTPIRVAFDQPVNHDTAEKNFSITPQVPGTFSWQNSTMIYTANLNKDTSYQVNIAPGIESLIGLPLQNASTTSFQTEESVTLLNIPIYYQSKPLSCEFASLKMALNFKGVNIDEATLIAGIPIDNTPRQGNIWGDPYQAFVGDINGKQNTTGYGVHGEPINTLASQYRTSHIQYSLSNTQIADFITNNDPVIFWGTAGNAKADPWITPNGRNVNGWVGEHVRLIIGFTGPSSRPTSFYINDPIFGRLHWTSNQLQSNMSSFGGLGVAIF